MSFHVSASLKGTPELQAMRELIRKHSCFHGNLDNEIGLLKTKMHKNGHIVTTYTMQLLKGYLNNSKPLKKSIIDHLRVR